MGAREWPSEANKSHEEDPRGPTRSQESPKAVKKVPQMIPKWFEIEVRGLKYKFRKANRGKLKNKDPLKRNIVFFLRMEVRQCIQMCSKRR